MYLKTITVFVYVFECLFGPPDKAINVWMGKKCVAFEPNKKRKNLNKTRFVVWLVRHEIYCQKNGQVSALERSSSLKNKKGLYLYIKN